MITVIQRVASASVRVDDEIVGSIDRGILALVGLEKGDSQQTVEDRLDRILSYRIFPDNQGRMNLSLRDTGGGLLLVSQFTLAANTQRGLRPSFSAALEPAAAQKLYEHLVLEARKRHDQIASGQFAADMQVSLINDGPVTFIL